MSAHGFTLKKTQLKAELAAIKMNISNNYHLFLGHHTTHRGPKMATQLETIEKKLDSLKPGQNMGFDLETVEQEIKDFENLLMRKVWYNNGIPFDKDKMTLSEIEKAIANVDPNPPTAKQTQWFVDRSKNEIGFRVYNPFKPNEPIENSVAKIKIDKNSKNQSVVSVVPIDLDTKNQNWPNVISLFESAGLLKNATKPKERKLMTETTPQKTSTPAFDSKERKAESKLAAEAPQEAPKPTTPIQKPKIDR